mgnify:CR=1 FL=1
MKKKLRAPGSGLFFEGRIRIRIFFFCKFEPGSGSTLPGTATLVLTKMTHLHICLSQHKNIERCHKGPLNRNSLWFIFSSSYFTTPTRRYYLFSCYMSLYIVLPKKRITLYFYVQYLILLFVSFILLQ